MTNLEGASIDRMRVNTAIIDLESEPGSWADALDRGCLTGRVADHLEWLNRRALGERAAAAVPPTGPGPDPSSDAAKADG